MQIGAAGQKHVLVQIGAAGQLHMVVG